MRRSSLALAAVVVSGAIAVAPAAGVPEQTPKRGGTLVIRVPGGEPACLNVLPMSCNFDFGQWHGSEKVLQTPFEVGPDFTYEESLVSRVDFTRRRPFTLTYHIHPEARWSDGVPVTAQDFIFTLQAIRRHASPEFRDFHAPIRSARAVDRKTLRVVLRPRSASWHDFFGNILPAHALRGSDLTQVWSDRIDDPRTGRPIGSGPFLVERLERGRQLVLRRNPRYWGPHPAYVERLVIRFAAVGHRSQRGAEERRARRRHGHSTIGRPGRSSAAGGALRRARNAPDFEHLDIQLGPNAHPALRNKLVRRALAYGIDRPALVRQIWGEVDPSARALDSAVHLAQSRYYEPNWSAYRYRPAEARRLLTQAGCRRGADGIFSCGGRAALVALRDERRDSDSSAGASPDPGAASGCRGRGRSGVRSPGDVLRPDPPGGERSTSHSSRGQAHRQHRGPASTAAARPRTSPATASDSSPRTSTRPTGSSTTVEHARVFNRADRGLASDVPTIPLFQFVFTAAYDTSVRNFVFLPWNPLWNAENWWLAE